MPKNSILKFLKLDGFVDSLTDYLETRVELLKVEMREDVAKALAKFSVFCVLAFAAIVFLLFASIALALWIGQTHGLVFGFTIIALLYLFIAIALLLSKKFVSKKIEKKLLKIVMKK